MANKFTRATINACLRNGGRPQRDDKVPRIVLALRDAGLSDQQCMALGCLISDARSGYDWCLDGDAQAVKIATRERHAAEHPNGMWAVLFRRYGFRARYMDGREPDAMSWARPMLDASYGPVDHSYPFA